jgi:hypothetical protein
MITSTGSFFPPITFWNMCLPILLSSSEQTANLRPSSLSFPISNPWSGCAHCQSTSFYLAMRRRQAKLLAAFASGPLTVYEAMGKLFTLDRSFELFLMISETLGNLELLEDKGLIERETEDAFVRFRLP